MALQFNIDEVFAKEIATDLPRILAGGFCHGYCGRRPAKWVFNAELTVS